MLKKKKQKKKTKTKTKAMWYMIELTWLFFIPPQIKFESKRNWIELKLYYVYSTLLYYLRMLKSINKNPKLSKH